MTRPGPAVHRTILVLDVKGFGDRRRTNHHQVEVRAGLYRCLEWAFDAANIPWDICYREDRGDGLFVLADPEVPKAPFVESLLQPLIKALLRHNRTRPPEEQIRLRMALHAGEIKYDKHGVAGSAINLAFRLIEAPELKATLTDSGGLLALIVSGWFYQEVVRNSPVTDAASYRPITVEVKETTAQAWIYLPDHPATPDPIVIPSHVAQRSSARAVPQQLPARPGSFTGRVRELAELTIASSVEAERKGTMPVIVIAGMGGMGKTWLALQWAHDNADRFPDGQLYVNLRGFDPTGDPVIPEVAVRGFLDALHLDASTIPLDPNAQTALYRSLVVDKHMLILLDNARDSDQVIPLLPGTSTCTVLVTTRQQLASLLTVHNARPLPLDVLTQGEARELLAKRLGYDRVEAEPAAVNELVRYCAGLPLALGIVAAHAATHADFPLTALASELGEASVRLDALDGGEMSANLRAVLSWSYQALGNDAAKVLRLLGLAPGPDIGVPAIKVLTGLSAPQQRTLFRQLENAHLVQRYSPTRYRMHDLIRLYAADRAATDDPVSHGTEALERLLSYYIHATYAGERLLYPHRKQVDIGKPPDYLCLPHFTDDASILKWFDDEHACLMAAQAAAVKQGWHKQVWQLAWTMHGYLWRRGHLHEQLDTWRAGLDAARELGDPALEGVAHRLLGQAYARARKTSEATYHLNQALELAKEAGDTHGEARSHYDFILVCRHKEDDRAALEHATEALRLFKTLDAPVWVAEALNMIGWHQAQLGDYAEARTSCERALALFRESSNRQGQAVTLDSLGYIAHHSAQYGQALRCFRESLDLCRDLGATYYEADTLEHLGHAHAALGQHAEARNVWQQALDLNETQHRTADTTRIRQQLDELEGG